MRNKIKTTFKETEIGKIPEDWDVKEIGDVCHLVRDSFSPSKEDSRAYIGLEHIEQDTLRLISIGSSRDINSNKLVFRKGQILFGKLRPYFKKVYRPNFDGVCSTDIFVIDANKEFDSWFLFYFFADRRMIEEATLSSEGTRMPRASWKYLEKLQRGFPDLSEQKAIAKILSDLDSKIELNIQMNDTLEAISQTLFKHWFIDFEFPNNEGKPYKSSGGEMVDSELGDIPEGWSVEKLGDYVDVVKGCSYRSDDLQESDKALVTLKSIERGGGFKVDGLKQYIGKYKDEQIISPGEIVVSHTDVTQKAEVLGKSAIVREVPKFSTLIASLDLCIVRPVINMLNRPFVYFLLKTDNFQNHAFGYANGTTVLHLNKKAIPEYVFVLPPKDLIHKFGVIVNNITEKIQENELNSETLTFMRDSLLPRLMSGRIRVGMNL